MRKELKLKLLLLVSFLASYLVASFTLDLLRYDGYIMPLTLILITLVIGTSIINYKLYFPDVVLSRITRLSLKYGVVLLILGYYFLYSNYPAMIVTAITYGIFSINYLFIEFVLKGNDLNKQYKRGFMYFIFYMATLLGLSFGYTLNDRTFYLTYLYLDIVLIVGCIYFSTMTSIYKKQEKIKKVKALYNKDGSLKRNRRVQLSTIVVVTKPIISYIFNLSMVLIVLHLLETRYYNSTVDSLVNFKYLRLTSIFYLFVISINSFKYNEIINIELRKALRITKIISFYMILGFILYPLINLVEVVHINSYEPIMTVGITIGMYIYFRLLGYINYENKMKLFYAFGFTLALFIGVNITNIFDGVIPGNGRSINLIYVNILLYTMFLALIAAVYLRKYVQDKPVDKLYQPRSVAQMFIVTTLLTSVMNFIIINVATTLTNSIYVLIGSSNNALTYSLLLHTILPGLLAAGMTVSVNSRDRKLNYALLGVRFISVIIFAYKMVESIDLIANQQYSLIGYVLCLYLSLAIATRVSERFTKFSQLVATSFIILILIEFIFYLLDIFEIIPTGLSLIQFRMAFAAYFMMLIFAYMYLRNMKLSKDNRVFSIYRFATICFSTVILFVTLLSTAGASNLKSNWVKEKFIELLMNSPLVDYIDPSILERIWRNIDLEKLPEGFDINDYLKYLTTYIKVDKETTGVSFYKESTAFTYNLSAKNVSEGWSYNTSNSVLNSYTSNPYNVTKDQFDLLDEYFKSKNAENWFVQDNTKLTVVTERLMTDNLLPYSQLTSELTLTNPTTVAKIYGDILKTDSTKVGGINMSTISLNFSDYNTLKALYEVYSSSNTYNSVDLTNFTSIPMSLLKDVSSISSTISATHNLNRTEKNDLVKLLAISDYIYENYTVDIPVFWTKKQNINDFISKQEGTLADAITLFTLVARANNIPVRPTLGYYVIGKSMEVKKELRMPSIEISIPGYGWVDGTYFALNMVNSNSNNISELNLNEIRTPVMGVQTSHQVILRDKLYTEYNGSSLVANTYCYDKSSHTYTNYKLLGLDSNTNNVAVVNYQLYKDSIALPLNTYLYQSANFSGKTNETCKQGSSDGTFTATSGLNALYGGRSDLIDWSPNTRKQVIDYFTKYSASQQDNLINFTSDVRFAISSHISRYSNTYSAERNVYRKLYKIKDSITKEFSVVNRRDSKSLLDVINTKEGTVNDLNKVLLVIARELGLNARLYSGYRTSGGQVSSLSYEYGIEIFMPTSNNNGIWIELPDDFRNFKTLVDDINIEVIEEGIEKNGFNYVETKVVYETEYRNLCLEFFKAKDPLVGNLTIKASEVNVLTKPANSNAKVDSNCKLTFDKPGTYDLYYSIISDLTGASAGFILSIEVSYALPIIHNNSKYNFDDNVVRLSNEGYDIISVIKGIEVGLCGTQGKSLVYAEDIFATIAKNNGRYNPNSVVVVYPTSDNVSERDCSKIFTNTTTIQYTFNFKDTNESVTRSSTHTFYVTVYDDTPVIENTTMLSIYETESTNLLNHFKSIRYLNGVHYRQSDVKLYVNGEEAYNFFDSEYMFNQDLGDNEYIDVEMVLVVKGVTQAPIYARVKRATPYNVSHYGSNSTVINGSTFKEALTSNIESIFTSSNVIKGINVDLTYEFDFYIQGVKQNANRIKLNDIYDYRLYRDNITSQTGAYFVVYVIETTTNRYRESSFIYSIVLDSASIRFTGHNNLSIVHGQSAVTNLVNYVIAKDANGVSYDITCTIINETTGKTKVVGCQNFRTQSHSDLGFTSFTNSYKLKYSVIDKTGIENSVEVKLNIIEPKPILEINSSVYTLYVGYKINFCDYIKRAESYFGTNLDYLVKWKYESTTYSCYSEKLITFTEADIDKVISVEYSLTSSDSTTKVIVQYRIALNTTPPEPDFSSISTLSVVETEVAGKKAIEQNTTQNLCKFIKATDNGNGSILYPKNLRLYKGREISEEALVTASVCGNYSKYFNEHGEYIISYDFIDTVGNKTVANVMLSVYPEVRELTLLSQIKTLSDNTYFTIHLQYIGDSNGLMHFVDVKGDNTYLSHDDLVFNNIDDLKIGDTIKATYLFNKSAGEIVLVNSYLSFDSTDFTHEVSYDINKELEFKGLSERCITNTFKSDYVAVLGTTINANFDTYKEDGTMYIKDRCGSVEYSKFIESYSFTGELKNNRNYRFNALVSLSGTVQLSDVTSLKLPSVWLSAKYIRIYIVVVVVILVGYFATKEIIKQIKNKKEHLKKQTELEHLPEFERKQIQLHYSKQIEKRYNNILLALRKYYNGTKINRSETHLEYAKRLVKGNVIDLHELNYVTEIYNRCRYAKDTINKAHFDYVEDYYHKMYDNFKYIIADEKLKNQVLKLKKY